MTILAALGFGYCARRLLALHPDLFSAVVGTARTPERLARIPAPVVAERFDGRHLSPALAARLEACDVLLVSAPPDADGDPVLRAAGAVLAAGRVGQVIYLTTIGVYGDHRGGVVDELTPPRPDSPRLVHRLEAEAQWLDFGRRREIPVAVLRLAGIYGPGRNALRQIAEGSARIIDKPGQVFNRIHVDDIVAAIVAARQRRFNGILNVTDDAPTAPGVPVQYAARLLGRPAPTPVPFAAAARDMSPMALSFWGASKRVSNARLARELGLALRYPTYREGLDALFAAGEGR